MKYLVKIAEALLLLIFMALAISCAKDSYFDIDSSSKEGTPYTPDTKGRVSPVVNRNVMIMVSGGRNSLSSYLKQDLEELESSDIPTGNYAADHILIVISRISGNKAMAAPAAMYQVYKDRSGNVVRDTLKTWEGFTPLFGESTLKDALKYVVNEIPATGYGIVLSSHATGYLPDGYYKDPASYEKAHPVKSSLRVKRLSNIAQEVFEPIPEYPAVKSVGQDDDANSSVEMELKAFRDAIPCHMDYILLDACLMAGVEVAYELRDKASLIGFSPTEILADGFNYKLIASRLLKDNPEPVQVCRDYFDQYREDILNTSGQSCATISAVNTEHMDALADVCRELFEKYRTQMSSVSAGSIQRYYRQDRHFFYDLRDILAKSGASAQDLASLDAVLDKAVIYKEHTSSFLGIQIDDNTYSGLSMYLPANGSAVLDKFYKENIDWNTVTQLVK